MKILAGVILLMEAVFFGWLFSQKYSFFPRERKLVFDLAKKIEIEGDGLNRTVVTNKMTVEEALAEKAIAVNQVDRLYPDKKTPLFPGSKIIIDRPVSVHIEVDGKKIENTTFLSTVEDAILEKEIHLSRLDEVEPARSARLREDMKIKITRIKHEEVAEEEAIDFKTITAKDSTVLWGEKTIKQKGEKGLRRTVYKISYENGEQVSKVKLNSEILRNPVTEEISLGTKIEVGRSDSGIASWYGTDPLSCSSRDFPAGTWLRVTNRQNGRQTFVRVEGYGPQAQTGKLIDLSKEAFAKLAPLGQGTTKVKVEEVKNRGFSYTGKE